MKPFDPALHHLDDLLSPELAALARAGRFRVFAIAAPDAARAKRYRERRKCGLRVVQLEVPLDIVDTLLSRGLIEPEDADDQSALAYALYLLIQEKIES